MTDRISRRASQIRVERTHERLREQDEARRVAERQLREQRIRSPHNLARLMGLTGLRSLFMTKDEQKIVDEVRESQSREAWFSEKVAELEALSDNFRKWATQNDVPQNITGGDRGWLIATQTVEGSRAEIVYDHRFPIHHPTRTFTHWMVPDQPAGRSPYTTVPTIEGFTVETVTIEDPINDRIHGPYGHGRCLTLPQQPDDSFFLNARDILEDGIAGWLADRPDAPWPPAS